MKSNVAGALVAFAVVAGCQPREPITTPPPDSVSATSPVADDGPSDPGGTGFAALDPSSTLDAIAFGSCLNQAHPHPILRAIEAADPDLFVWMGDNVYADGETVQGLHEAYDALGQSELFTRFVANVPQLAIWDDHDYGINDAGREYPLKAESKTIMLDFFGEPKDSPRRKREGNYDAVVLGPPGQRVQIILLDTRWFRDALVDDPSPGRRYQPTRDPASTMLGAAQWTWLEQQLREPAEIRIIVSSIQLIVGDHGYESWGLFPVERDKMFSVLAETDAAGVVVLSGDRHRGELSCAQVPELAYPLIELTTSSLNKPALGDEPNRYRVAGTDLFAVPNFGTATMTWGETPRIELALRGEQGQVLMSKAVPLAALQPNSGEMSGLDCVSFKG